MESSPGPITIVDGKPYNYFAGTSYDCLHGHPDLIQAAIDSLHKYGLGSAMSREGFGDNPVLLEVAHPETAQGGLDGSTREP